MVTLANGISSKLYGAWLQSENGDSLCFLCTLKNFRQKTIEDLKNLNHSKTKVASSSVKVSLLIKNNNREMTRCKVT